MKNKYLLLGLSMSLMVGVMTSCQKKDVDVFSSSKAIAEVSMIGDSKLLSASQADGLNLTMVEYQFLGNRAVNRVTMTWGDGVSSKQETSLVYSLGDFASNGAGLDILFSGAQGVTPFTLRFISGGLQGDAQIAFLGERAAKVSNVEKIEQNVPGTSWEHLTMLWHTNKVEYDSMIITKHIEIIGGKRVIVADTTYKKFTRIDTLGVQSITRLNYTFRRDAQSLRNEGHCFYSYSEWNDSLKLIADTLEDYDFHWGISELVSSQKFTMHTISNDTCAIKKDVNIAISKFNPAKKSCIIDGFDCTLVEEQ